MDELFRNIALNELVRNKGYSPLKYENGNTPAYENLIILQKDMWGALTVAEVIDGDLFTARQIKERMDYNWEAASSANSGNAIIFAEIFVFNSDIPEEKLDVIKNMQKKGFWKKRHLVSFTVQLRERTVQRLFSFPFSVDGLENTLKKILDIYAASEPAYMPETGISDGTAQEPAELPAPVTPVVTYTILAINIAMWLLTNAYSYLFKVDANLIFGGKYNVLIMEGQYWRLVMPIFLHALYNPIHIFVNSYSLYVVGPQVERILGRWKFAAVYLAAGIVGNIASFAFSSNPSVGASGAIFGLLGALLYIWQRYRKVISGSFGTGIIITILFNVIYGFSSPNIDNFAHLGGLAGGYLAAAAAGLVRERGISPRRVLSAGLIAVLAFGLYYKGVTDPSNVEAKRIYDMNVLAQKKLTQAVGDFNAGRYADSESIAREVLSMKDIKDDIRYNAADIAASSLINQQRSKDAIDYAKSLVVANPARGHYLLGLCYSNMGENNLARDELTMALEADPSDTQVKSLLDSLPK